ncbi:hypothetical protein [Polyangium jinanense]|uniref:Lipoprotein n=1 Tax=Polyangium jinanense TaxID=2829994 RepID=A0A9X3X4C7_9BACT|nr:hypothetical protein [Polyangium jinanense]MDC3955039.1 hypothetical protein [Polyangium jinanense]MDC3981191.1 hypothetical protein [Polyangium jinanense]
MKRLVAPVVLAALVTALPARADPPSDPDPFFGRDKALHFGFSAALAGGAYGATALYGLDGRANRVAVGMAVALGAGYTKEILDAAGFGTPSWKDFAWDLLGTAVGLGVSVAIDYALSPSPSEKSGRPAPAR